MRFVITCSGPAERWGNYLGVPKHLIPVVDATEQFPSTLLQRVVRQLTLRGFRDIVVTAKNIPLYKSYVTGAEVSTPFITVLPDTGLGHSFGFWSTTETTVVLLGDVFFSNAAIDSICEHSKSDEVITFGRSGSGNNGHKYGELFAFSIPLSKQTKFVECCREVGQMAQRKPRGWEVYRHLNGLDLDCSTTGKGFVEIDDETEDFDFPEDYIKWLARPDKS